MKPNAPKPQRCAIYTRKSTEHNLDLAFNSLDAQREACEAYIKSQAHEGWRLIAGRFDDGGLSGASLERPALQALLDQVRAQKIDVIVVYKVDRLTRALADFAKLVELFDEHGVSFVSVTQSFNTTSSMGRLTLNVLLSFAQFEREVIGERVDATLAGRIASFDEIACAEGLAERHVRFLMPLAFLSPRIIAAINQGTVPPRPYRIQSRPRAPGQMGRPGADARTRLRQDFPHSILGSIGQGAFGNQVSSKANRDPRSGMIIHRPRMLTGPL
jgi:predicted site-specific integrase-resolvase